jgi:CheY-like chemotaxis protein
MKILFVEDHDLFADSVKMHLSSIIDLASVTHVRSRDEARELLSTEFFDLLILDLAILESSGGLSAERQFGEDVFRHSQARCPGLPIFFLTTSEPDDELMGFMRETDRYDIWGEGQEVSALDYCNKVRSTDAFFESIGKMAKAVNSLQEISIDTRGRKLELSDSYERAIRVYTRQKGSDVIEVRPLDGGKSRARVLHGLVKNADDEVIVSSVLKLGPLAAIEQERLAYERDVTNLPNGSYTPMTGTVLKGTCGAGVLIYSLAETFDRNIFSLLLASDEEAATAVSSVADSMRRWTIAGRIATKSVEEIRHRLLWEEDFLAAAAKYAVDYSHYERTNVRHRISCIHGDLHGGNILVDRAAKPILIDFGEVGEGATALDPVSLDLSIFFHPDAVELGLRAKAEEALLHWRDPAIYQERHPFPKFAKACREWAYDIAGGDRAVDAAAYTYLVRQLKFDSVDHAPTLALLANITVRP